MFLEPYVKCTTCLTFEFLWTFQNNLAGTDNTAAVLALNVFGCNICSVLFCVLWNMFTFPPSDNYVMVIIFGPT
jgi:hypothetical protein